MNNQQLKKFKLKIHGMHCSSCAVLIERKFKSIQGIERADVNHADGKAVLFCSCDPNLSALQRAVEGHGYSVSRWSDGGEPRQAFPHRNTSKDYLQIGAIFLIITALYLILRQLDLIPQLGISDQMSYGFVFLIGLVAAMSTCLAVTGGLLLSVAAKYNERHPELTGYQKFKPTLYFNIGRIAGYTVLGGLVGALGSLFTFSVRATGVMTIIASLVMIVLGFQLLHLFPWLKRFQPRMPKFIAHKVHDLSERNTKATPFLLGAATFFLPCGFTQALQLYVLSQESFTTGALTMFAFSLGTLPALMSLSALSSFVKGKFQRYFLKFAGVTVLMLGMFNINNGLALTGSTINLNPFRSGPSQNVAQAADPNVELVDGTQIVRMKVVGLDYYPHRFTVTQGIPVEWQIDGRGAQGCAQVITVPKLGITEYLPPQGVKTITFTPQEPGTIAFSCTMGMTTRGSAFTVVAGDLPKPLLRKEGTKTVSPPYEGGEKEGVCNPDIMNCVPAQKISMEISRERGFYPNVFTVKKGVPVELEIDTKTPMGGCMSTMVIPEYNVAHLLALGKSTVKFTPTRTGTVPFTCSMGSRMGQIAVID